MTFFVADSKNVLKNRNLIEKSYKIPFYKHALPTVTIFADYHYLTFSAHNREGNAEVTLPVYRCHSRPNGNRNRCKIVELLEEQDLHPVKKSTN